MSLFVKAAHFAKTTAAATASQPITGVGFQPKAILFFLSGGTVSGTIQTQATADARGCIGMVSGTAVAEHSAAAFEADTTAAASGRRNTQKAICLVDSTGTVVAECVLSSFDADGFTLSWTTNNAEAQVISYLALGGSDVQAKVLPFTFPVAIGNTPVTGCGFQPNLLILASATTAAFDTSSSGYTPRFGAAVSSTSRWSSSAGSALGATVAAWRKQITTACLDQMTTTGTSDAVVTPISMDADGYTLNATTTTNGAKVGVLCLKVPQVAIGVFPKPTGAAPAAGTVSGLAFSPKAVILASVNNTTNAAASQTGARLQLSAFTTAGTEAQVVSVPNAPVAHAYADLAKAKAAVKIDNATPAIDAEATGLMTGDGFTLTWNANDAVATELAYIAIGEPNRRSRHRRKPLKLTHRPRKSRGAWRRRAA